MLITTPPYAITPTPPFCIAVSDLESNTGVAANVTIAAPGAGFSHILCGYKAYLRNLAAAAAIGSGFNIEVNAVALFVSAFQVTATAGDIDRETFLLANPILCGDNLNLVARFTNAAAAGVGYQQSVSLLYYTARL